MRWLSRDGTPRTAKIPLWLVVVPVAVPVVLGIVIALLWNGEWSPARMRQRLDAMRRENERIDRELSTARGGMDAAVRALRIPEKEKVSVRELAGLPGEEPARADDGSIPDVGAMIAGARRIRQGYDAMERWFEMHPAETGRLPTIRPVNSTWPLVEGFGPVLDPFTGQKVAFPGLAWNVPVGTPVWATGAGSVSAIGNSGRWGRYVEIRHDGRCMTFYANLSRVDVHEGETVIRGQVLGLSGESGKITGPRLSYAVFLDGEAVDPTGFLLPEQARPLLPK